MALQECRECGREVSTEAESCPECGVPAPTEDADGGAGSGAGERQASRRNGVGLRRTRERRKRRAARPGLEAVAKIVLVVLVGGGALWALGSAALNSASSTPRNASSGLRSQPKESPASAGSRRGSPEGYVQVTEESPIGWKLAAVDAGTDRVGRNQLRRYEYYLDRLARKCAEARERIANVALTAVESLEKQRGVEMTAYRMLQHMDEAVPAGAEPVSCPGVAALLAAATEPR